WLKQNSLIDYFLIDYSIDIAYNSLQRVKEMLDGISFNNEYVHDLNKLLCKEYNQEVFTQLTEKTFLFKLSWKNYSIEELEKNTSNFYHHLKAIVKE
ncbi:MAG: capsular polysaccharide synthesis protein, partial [Cellulosilyticaceae bacterium]